MTPCLAQPQRRDAWRAASADMGAVARLTDALIESRDRLRGALTKATAQRIRLASTHLRWR